MSSAKTWMACRAIQEGYRSSQQTTRCAIDHSKLDYFCSIHSKISSHTVGSLRTHPGKVIKGGISEVDFTAVDELPTRRFY